MKFCSSGEKMRSSGIFPTYKNQAFLGDVGETIRNDDFQNNAALQHCWDIVLNNTKLNAGLALRQKADLLQTNILANKISLPQGQSFTDTEMSFNVF